MDARSTSRWRRATLRARRARFARAAAAPAWLPQQSQAPLVRGQTLDRSRQHRTARRQPRSRRDARRITPGRPLRRRRRRLDRARASPRPAQGTRRKDPPLPEPVCCRRRPRRGRVNAGLARPRSGRDQVPTKLHVSRRRSPRDPCERSRSRRICSAGSRWGIEGRRGRTCLAQARLGIDCERRRRLAQRFFERRKRVLFRRGARQLRPDWFGIRWRHRWTEQRFDRRRRGMVGCAKSVQQALEVHPVRISGRLFQQRNVG